MTTSASPDAISLLAKAHILIVEDSIPMQELLCTCLKAFDVPKVIAVETPMECLEELGNQPLDALIVDWRLKEHDGLVLVRQIRREMPDPLCRIPIILCTGYSELPRVLEARDSGVDEMLCKPVSPKGLYSKLSSALLSDRKFVVTDTYAGPERRTPRRDPISESGNPVVMIDDIFV